MKLIDIGDVAERSGVAPSALRYYEEIKLIRSVGRHGLRRQFEPSVLLKLSLIGLGRAAGFSLKDIGRMFDETDTLRLPRTELHAKADEIQRQMVELRGLRDALRHVADCPAPSHLECPSFRKLIRSASRSRKPEQGALQHGKKQRKPA